MKLGRRRFISITAGLVASAAAPQALAARPVTWRGVALGAAVRLQIAGLPEGEAARLIDLARVEIDRLETIFSLYRPTGSLARLNRSGQITDPPAELLQLLSTVRTVHELTSGMFDPTIQPLWSTYAQSRGMPSERQVADALHLVGWKKVRFDARQVRLARGGMQLTLNGIAQGFITDRIAELLRSEGLADAVVDMGEIAALGHHPGGGDWRIGLAVRSDQPADQYVSLPGGHALATSSTLGTRFENGAGHILNPLTGQPAAPYWERMSVIHGQAVIADGLSTAAVMLDDDGLYRLAGIFPDAKFIARRHDDQELVLGRTV